jgi:uncharacterized protein (TIGR02452 family)
MNRQQRIDAAKQTVAICDAGFYRARDSRRIDLADQIQRAVAGTVLYSPENMQSLTLASVRRSTKFEVRNETTFSALRRLAARGKESIGCLNFASARNPGGGFLSGAQAQEESLARASALYPCLLARPEYYERNRVNRSALYLDLILFSPGVPFFRDDAGNLLDEPITASVMTAPAPNAGAVAANEPEKRDWVEPTLRRRADMVLRIAAVHGIKYLVLGAWGCGVFRNAPSFVAGVFAGLLTAHGSFAGSFEEVLFAVYDRSEGQDTYCAFADAFANIITKPVT